MTYWEKYIFESKEDEKSNKKELSAKKRKAAQKVLDELTKKKSKNKKNESAYTKYLKQQLEFKKQKYEDQKKRQIEKAKDAGEKDKAKAKEALSKTNIQRISYKDADLTAHGKAVENLGSLAFGLAKAAHHGLESRKKRKEAEKKALESQNAKKEPGQPGRPKTRDQRPNSDGAGRDVKGQLPGTPERKKLVPSTKRLPPASKKIGPAGGAPYQAPPAPQRGTGMSLGQRARRNPALKSALIKTRMEEYSNWREEFLFEVDDKMNKVEKKKIIDIMQGKNNIEMNPSVMEDHKEIESGHKKDDEGYMANVELDQMERAIKALRKKVKKADTQLPAWVQSKITRAADYIDTASEYMQSESYEDDMFRQHSKSEMNLPSDSSSSATKSFLKRMRELNMNPEKPKKKKKKKEKVMSEEMDKKKILILMLLKALENQKRRKNSQLINGIIGEGVDKDNMKCNKPKAQAHGSGETGKSHVVKACEGGEEKLIRFGQLGVKGSPKKKGESKAYASRRHKFQTRHAKNIARGKMSAAYWANKVKW